jgi:hypothetical protein
MSLSHSIQIGIGTHQINIREGLTGAELPKPEADYMDLYLHASTFLHGVMYN